jgi:hypothetical protein
MLDVYIFVGKWMIASLQTQAILHQSINKAQSPIRNKIPIKPATSPSFDACQDCQVDNALS